MNKKAQTSTDTPIILSILVFQTFVVLMLGFLNVSSTEIVSTNTGNALFSFGNIISNISYLGWGNILIFSPLIICLIYIIAKLVRGGG
jgi:hypothetical protein